MASHRDLYNADLARFVKEFPAELKEIRIEKKNEYFMEVGLSKRDRIRFLTELAFWISESEDDIIKQKEMLKVSDFGCHKGHIHGEIFTTGECQPRLHIYYDSASSVAVMLNNALDRVMMLSMIAPGDVR